MKFTRLNRIYSMLLVAVWLLGGEALAQLRPVPAELIGERLIAVVPMIGTGKAGDPKRPKYVPVPPVFDGKTPIAAPRSDWDKLKPEEKADFFKQQIQGFSYVLADDKRRAIVEFVAGDRRAFAAILQDKDVQAFEPKDYHDGKGKKDAVEAELKKAKKDFDFGQLRTKSF